MRPTPALVTVAAAFAASVSLAPAGMARAAAADASTSATITCAASPGLPAGAYALDFVLTGTSAADLEPAATLEDSLQRIQEQLFAHADLLPSLADDFRAFAADLLNTQDATRSNFWLAAPDLDAASDPSLAAARIPAACRDAAGAPRIVPALVRDGSDLNANGTKTTTYSYVPAELDALRMRAPLQASMLLVHAWLWRVTPDAAVMSKLNRLLHSHAIASLSDRQLRRRLESLGLDLARLGLGAGETILATDTLTTQNGIGMSPSSACAAPRREYAELELRTLPLTCAGLAGDRPARVVTRSYTETVGATGGQLFCSVQWAYACVAAP